VLVADDEPGVRQVLAQAIADAGGRAFAAANGVEAIAILEQTRLDVAVVDMFMPHKDGVETIMEARRRWPGLKLVAISGGGQFGIQDTLELADLLGADLTLCKPFSAANLIARIARLLGPTAYH